MFLTFLSEEKWRFQISKISKIFLRKDVQVLGAVVLNVGSLVAMYWINTLRSQIWVYP